MLNKKIKLIIILFTGVSITISAPLIAIKYIVKKDSNNNKKYDFSYVFGKNYKNSKLANIDVKDINYKDLNSLPENLNSHFGYNILSGGFGELRKYYKKPSINNNEEDKKSIHLGLDVIIPKKNPIYSPFNAEVINSIWIKSKKETIAYGSGGSITLKIKLEDLNIKNEFKELLYFKYYREHLNSFYPNGKRIESFYFTQPKIQFANFGEYKAPTNNSLKGFNKSEITLATKEEYKNFINSYTHKKVLNSSKEIESQKIDSEFIEFLKESPKYIYITIMHLSKDSLNIWGETAIAPDRNNLIYYSKKINGERQFQKIKKGDEIGFIGDKNENGGWISHIHLETFTTSLNLGSFFNANSIFKWETNKRYFKYPNGKGTLSIFSSKDSNATENYLKKNEYKSFEQFAQSRNIINSNNIFGFYKKDSKLIKLKETD